MTLFQILNYLLIIHVSIVLSWKEKNGIIRLDLIRQKTPREQFMNAAAQAGNYINGEWLNKGIRTNDSIALYKYLDNEFYGKIVIGHPGQSMNVAFDTAWTLAWVLSSTCSSIGCMFHNKYDHRKSSYWKKDNRPYNGNEGTYNFTGFYSYENISIAHSNVTQFSFVEMVNVPKSFLFNKADGVLGLGLRDSNGDYEPFFYTLYRQKKIRNPIFSIYLNRDRQSNAGGNVILGFIEPRHIHKQKYKNGSIIPATIKYLPVDPGEYWQFSMDRILVKPERGEQLTLCEKGCKAIADTSANTIMGPEDSVSKIHDLINAKLILDQWRVNCDTVNKLPKIVFILGGQEFLLKGPEYILQMSFEDVTFCVSAFRPSVTPSVHDMWVLGGAFLSEYYSIYNINTRKIGFVKAA